MVVEYPVTVATSVVVVVMPPIVEIAVTNVTVVATAVHSDVGVSERATFAAALGSRLHESFDSTSCTSGGTGTCEEQSGEYDYCHPAR